MGKEEKVEEVEVISEEKLVEVKKEKKKKKKKKDRKPMNLFVLFFLMLLAVAVEEVLAVFVPSFALSAVKYGRYGLEVIAEGALALLIIVIIFIFGFKYIFTEKGESFKNSIKVGMPFFLMALLITISNLGNFKGANPKDFISLVLYMLFVGIYEELLCRGWLLNVFVRKHNKKYGQVILSIALSSLVFGCMHFLNVFSGQTFFQSLMQVFQTTALGFLLGAIYYRTKNIYSVIFLHGFFDFGIMLGEMNMLRDCTAGEATRAIMIYDSITSAAIALMYLTWALYILRKEKVYPLLDEPKEYKKSSSLKPLVVVLSIVLFFGPNFIKQPKEYENYKTCYEYEEIEIGISELHYPQTKVYEFGENGFAYKLELEKEKLILTNKGTKENITLFEKVSLYEVVKEANGYIIIVVDSDANNNERVNYSTVIIPSMYSDNKEFLSYIKDSFNYYVIPSSVRLGYLTNKGTDYVYPLIDVAQEKQFVIDEKGKLKLVKFTDEEPKKYEKPVEVVPEETVKEAVDPMSASEEIVGAGITDEQIEEIINQADNGAQIGQLAEQ